VKEHRARSRLAWIAGIALFAITIAITIAVGATAVVLPGCSGCHLDSESFKTSTIATPHTAAGTTCVECHVDTDHALIRTKFATYQVFGMWLPILNPAATDATVVSDSLCLNCHQEVMEGTLEVSGMRIIHASCAEGRDCIDCHSEVGHADATPWPRVTSMNDCTKCHTAMSITIECDACHTGKRTATRSAKPEFGVTHGPTWQQTHGMGQMSSCSVCHQEDKCARCHGSGVPHPATFLSSHAEISTREDAACSSCHDDTFCFGCHQTEMPHPPGFAARHSERVALEGEAPCLRCHAETDCSNCHVKHVHPGGAVGNIPSPGRGDS
jgi:hypothetical protein